MDRPILRYIYGKPKRSRVVKLDIDIDLEAKLSAIATRCQWHEGHLYRYLLLLGLHQFREHNNPHEADVGVVHDDPTAYAVHEKD